MTKLNLITFMLIFILSVHSQYRPPSPPRILIWTISVTTLMKNFQNAICTQCGRQSKYCSQNMDRINKIPQTGFFKPQSILNNVYNITQANFTINNVSVSCSFPKRQLIEQKMDYVLYMPISKTKVLKGVVMYYHHTLFGTKDVPTSSTEQINAIASLYLTSGYVVIFINYLGYKKTNIFPHPYVQYAPCNTKSSIMALNSALPKLKDMFPSIIKFKLFVVGYAEGAAYALWLERCLAQPQDCGNVKLDSAYEYHAAAAMEGPYDLVTIFKPFLVNDIAKFPEKDNKFEVQSQAITNFGKAPLAAMTLISYLYYSQGIKDFQSKINTQFWKMQCTNVADQEKCEVNGTQYANIYKALKSTEDSKYVTKSIAHSAFGKKHNIPKITFLGTSQIEQRTLSSNSVYGLAEKQLMNSQLFNETMRNASAINNAPKKNVFLFTLKKDSVVSPNNTFNYIQAHKNTGKVSSYILDNSIYQVCEIDENFRFHVDHHNGQLLANLFALSFIKNNTQ